jgi:hypothetical protein
MIQRSLLAASAATAVLAVVLATAAADEAEVEFTSATECRGAHGVYRWEVKTDQEAPPETIAPDHKVKPSDIGKWPVPRGVITTHTPRSGREKEWFEVTGRVALVKAEADGDLHIQLVDADAGSKVNVVVEVPVRQHPGDSPWSDIRQKVFGWTKTSFPFSTKSDKRLDLTKNPVIRVEGKAFYDATHAGHGGPPNRRTDAGEGEEVTVWEIHPVMVLEVIESP